jgi:hypothetical protein
MNKALALQILIPSGQPNGIKLIKVSGWDGLCYIIPRQSLNELSTGSDVNNPGLYFLFGKDESVDEQLAYIGESETFFKRITSHNAHRDFWDEAVVFTGDLNKAHVKYLEHKAVHLAEQAGRMRLDNSNIPPENRLSEYDKVGVELFFSNVKFILEAFGYDIFKSLEESVSRGEIYYLKGGGYDATARLLDNGEMLVLAGSLASVYETNSFGGWAKAAREQLTKEGVLIQNEGYHHLTKDVAFRSPSAAASTVTGRSTNGWTTWKDGEGYTLDQNLRQGKDHLS